MIPAPGSLVALRQAAAAHQRAEEERLAAALEREAAKVRELEELVAAAKELTDVEQDLEQLRSEYATRRELHSAALLAVCRKAITRVPRLAAVMTAEQALEDPERVLAWLLSAAGTAHPTAPAAGLIPPTPPTLPATPVATIGGALELGSGASLWQRGQRSVSTEAAEQAEEGSCSGAAAPSRCPGLMEEARPPAREAASSDAPPPKRTRYTETCWGDVVSGGALGCEALPPQASRAAFRERFCGGCRQRGVFVPASRVRMPIGAGSDEIANRHGRGFWNEPSRASRLPAHRVVNQTSDCSGPTLVILKDELPGPLPGLAEAAALSTSGGWVAFTVGRTLRSEVALPSAVAIPLSPPPPPERDTPEARTASAEGRVEGFAAAAQAGEASGSALEAGLEPFLAEISLALGPLAEAGAPPPPGPGEMTWHFGGGSPIDDLLLSGSATPPLLQTRPTPAASVPPPSMPPSPPAMHIPLRLDVMQSKPVQLSLALLVMVAARLAELDTTNPAAFIVAAGFGLLALANLAQASPRCLACAMALVLACAPTMRLVSVLVRSPEALARELDTFAGVGRCITTMAAATGAALGALPPSALPPTRKLLAVGYCACMQMCVALILRVRTGHESAVPFYLLHIVLPFLASFLAAHAASRSSVGQDTPASAARQGLLAVATRFRSDILEMRDCSASLPRSPPAMHIPLRLDVMQSKPVQLSLALLVMVAARLAELDTTNPAAFIVAAGFGLLALANLAQASPRFLARALTLLLVCVSTMRLVSVFVCSPEAMARAFDKLAGAGRCVITLAAACGAALGALPPSALPPTRKLLAAGYIACALACVGFILRVRTGHESAVPFYLLHIVLPFLASFLAAHAASRSSVGQDTPASAARQGLLAVATRFRSDILEMRDCSASLPRSPPAMHIPLRLDVMQSKPVQLSLALLVMVAARLAELDTTNPAAFIVAAGFGLLALANLAQASPRCLAHAMALVLACAPTMRLVSVLVRSPEALARELDTFAGVGRCITTMAAATGAALGALPPSALPPTRKLLAVGYCACVQMCVALILRVRTGDERAPPFQLLHIVLPFLASFLAAHAASRSSVGQNVARRGYSMRLACDEC